MNTSEHEPTGMVILGPEQLEMARNWANEASDKAKSENMPIPVVLAGIGMLAVMGIDGGHATIGTLVMLIENIMKNWSGEKGPTNSNEVN